MILFADPLNFKENSKLNHKNAEFDAEPKNELFHPQNPPETENLASNNLDKVN